MVAASCRRGSCAQVACLWCAVPGWPCAVCGDMGCQRRPVSWGHMPACVVAIMQRGYMRAILSSCHCCGVMCVTRRFPEHLLSGMRCPRVLWEYVCLLQCSACSQSVFRTPQVGLREVISVRSSAWQFSLQQSYSSVHVLQAWRPHSSLPRTLVLCLGVPATMLRCSGVSQHTDGCTMSVLAPPRPRPSLRLLLLARWSSGGGRRVCRGCCWRLLRHHLQLPALLVQLQLHPHLVQLC